MLGRHRIQIKDDDQIRVMRRAGLVVAEGLAEMVAAAVPGATTADLDRIGREVIARHGATSNFLGYGAEWGIQPYPGVACISVNEVIVHGIPDERELHDGDIVSIDYGAIVDGWHGDAARTALVGEVSDEVRELSEATRKSMWDGIAQIAPGARIGDVSSAVQVSLESHEHDYGIIRDYTGHGIGTEMHMDPDVPNWGRAHRGPRITEGMCLCVEPMATLGDEENVTLDDDWTVRSLDGSWSSHWENTVAVTRNGLWVLTEPDGGEAELTARGVAFGPLD
ncbi:type I methionyl aminopeptidase [Acidipropionibacterium jensenii]|uniref:Methionine aminopeptidase n=1 Tax=Acidipropionibacterium jensenii TaxID=1749 RepID=A0A3S4UZ73_9ACTN|nr:type I methionyl aminopeptidase [Acidipropionibacterium jensenii]AZZ38916.1 type I methionyl aminopeptidase [Acidipropionibacterium jensenii]AZZ42716.1 type I methionyl aminopeptidase [Acidipropionibacterium jensenii]MDN5978023.1 type I methionyl aminopeptidase [Acidipropionibacterium jensenii]MDN5995239.1 type I methionyl aminopeptidase [Acidipropionibacterium jensenii]MDN6022004.1 type I methionyl aminopeptidase [Acidipropionibacterium jensenii]